METARRPKHFVLKGRRLASREAPSTRVRVEVLGSRLLSRRNMLLLGGSGLVTLLTDQEARALSLAQGQLIYANARSMIGVPYAWGAPNWPRNTDCSRLTQAAYASAGIAIPRTAADQYRACRYSMNRIGALLFFSTDDARPGVVTHVGISRGDGSMVDANSAQGVVEERWAASRYWSRRFIASASL